MKKWTDLIHEYGVEGARSAWEDACGALIRLLREGMRVERVDGAGGDEGIDILVGETTQPVDVYQCKFFPNGVADSQKDQIRRSYQRAKGNSQYQLKDWYLCLPKAMTLEEITWFDHWRAKHVREGHRIESVPPDTLMLLAYQQNMIGALFNDDQRQMLEVILAAVIEALDATKRQNASNDANAEIERAASNILGLLAMKVHGVMQHPSNLLNEHYQKAMEKSDANAAANFLSSALIFPSESRDATQRDIFAMSQGAANSLAYEFVKLYGSHIKFMEESGKQHLLNGQPLKILYDSLLDPSLKSVRLKYHWPF